MSKTFKEQLSNIKDQVPLSSKETEDIKKINNKVHKSKTRSTKKDKKRSSKKKIINRIKNRERLQREKNLNERLKVLRPKLERIKARDKKEKDNIIKRTYKSEEYILENKKSIKEQEDKLIELGTHERTILVCKICMGDGGLDGNCYSCGGTGFVTGLEKIKND